MACLSRAFGCRSGPAVDPLAAQTREESTLAMTADPSAVEEWHAGREENGAQGRVGASINAKVLQGSAPYDMSLMLHFMYGLDQYPQYLRKWPVEAVDEAVRLLEERLAQARESRDALQARAHCIASYAPLHPELRTPEAADVLTPAALAVAAQLGKKTPPTLAELKRLLGLVEETPGVYSFDLLTQDCCDKLRAELVNYAHFRDSWMAAHDGAVPPGALRERLQLVDAGLSGFEAFLFRVVAKPLAKILFASDGSRSANVGLVDTPHTFFVGYGPTENVAGNVTRKALVPHIDDAEVTLNVCLSADFDGGGLQFHGIRTPQKTSLAYDLPTPNQCSYQHRLGRAVIHLGAHFHEVLDVTRGERHVLIMWCRSWREYRASHCPCCLKFRRDFCICSPEWN